MRRRQQTRPHRSPGACSGENGDQHSKHLRRHKRTGHRMGYNERTHLYSPGPALHRQEMIKVYFLITAMLSISFLNACDSAGKPVVENENSVPVLAKNEKPQTAIAHSLENQTPKDAAQTGEKSKWTQSGDPVDTKEFDSAIA